jgi:hypothetical protein
MDIVRKKWKIILIIIAALLLWTFIVCYPNPYVFIRNFLRYMHFPVDPSVVGIINEEIPNDPVEIDKFVDKLVKYEYDWVNYGVPWYVPTPDDAVTRRKGDCESRAMVLASILSAKSVPYSLKASLVHIWVEYPGKKPNTSENDDVSYVGKVDGRYRIKLPDLNQWRKFVSAEKEMLWDVMPSYRKVIMFSGWVVILFSGCFLFVRLVRKGNTPLAPLKRGVQANSPFS